MNNAEIKIECERLYDQIKLSNVILEEIRSECPHDDKEQVNYSLRIGHISAATVCIYCGELIEWVSKDDGK